MIGYFDAKDGNPKIVLKVEGTNEGVEKEAIAGLELFVPYISLIDFKNKTIKFVKEEDLKKHE